MVIALQFVVYIFFKNTTCSEQFTFVFLTKIFREKEIVLLFSPARVKLSANDTTGSADSMRFQPIAELTYYN